VVKSIVRVPVTMPETGMATLGGNNMPEFRVRWEIDEDAGTPRRAAKQARDRMLDTDSVADVFDVENPKTGLVTRIDFHAVEFGEKPEAVIRRNGRSYDLTREQITTIHQALRLALDFKESYFTLAPQSAKSESTSDYNQGDEAAQHKREEIARGLLDEFFA
jgi:hypothetical protein